MDIQINQQLYYYIHGIPAVLLPDGFYSLQTNIPENANEIGWQPQLYDFDDIIFISPTYNNVLIGPNRYYPLFGRPPTQFNAYRFKSEYTTDYRFNRFQSVVVLSNIPILQETLLLLSNLPTPTLSNTVSYISSLLILSDFRSWIQHYSDQNQDLIYCSQAEYRWIDLISDGLLDRLSFNFQYQIIDQNIYQLMIPPGKDWLLYP